MHAVAAWAGATAAGAIMSGAPVMDVATAMSGAAGAALGHTAGRIVSMNMADSSYAMLLPIAGAIAVPGLAGGIWDAQVVVIGLGAVAGCMIYSQVMKKE